MRKPSHPTHRRLKESLEIRHIKRRLTVAAVLFGLPCVLFPLGKYGPGLSAVPYFLVPFGIIWVFYLWRLFRIFSKENTYLFFHCILDQPHVDPNLHSSIYFTVTLTLPDGTEKKLDTHSIFALRGIDPVIENYVNQVITIAYNPDTGMVVVIG